MKRNYSFILFFFSVFLCFSQASNKDLIIKEEILKDQDSLFISNFYYESSWFVSGVTYETSNSLFGVSFSNGLKEQPIIHFEDLQANILYYVNAQTDFKNDYSFNVEFGLNYPIGRLYYSSIEFLQKNIKSNNFFQRDINIKSTIGLGFLKLNSSLLLNLGHQTLKSKNNFGVSVGWQKSHRINLTSSNSSLYYGFLLGKYKEYNNYSIFLHSFLFKNKMSFRLSYDKVNNTNFLNFGLNIIFYKFDINENN